MKLSNKFTLSRVIFAPIFFILYNLPLWWGSATLTKISGVVIIPLLIIIEFTDFFDGYYARKNGDVSDFGKLFDPFADVMLNLTLFLCCTRSLIPNIHYMPLVIFIFIMYREFSMLFLRMMAISHGVAIAAKKGGKLKTVTYITSGVVSLLLECSIRLGFTFINESFLAGAVIVTRVLFSLCLLLSYISFIDYIKTFFTILKNSNK